ncbi:MAG TPA: roadblock/LC7 domain-containing protein [Longimicrobiales bacterium]
MKTVAPADLQRWSEEVARDASSLSFLPLARAYRKQGKRDASLRLCLRGLQHHPHNVDAHALLAILYFEAGQRVKAYDEWSMVLTIEPDNFDALRGMGFYFLEQEDYQAAKRHLERATALKPQDPAVQEGLRIVKERLGAAARAELARELEPWETDVMPWEEPDAGTVTGEVPGPATGSGAAAVHAAAGGAPIAVPYESGSGPESGTAPGSGDPQHLFDPIMGGDQILGALLLDTQGLVMAGALTGELAAQAEALGAILGGAVEEARRTADHLALGQWKGVLLEADTAQLHFAPVQEGMIVLLAAQRNAPAGWVLRAAHQATDLASRFLEAYA